MLAEWAAIALSVGLSWPPVQRRRSAGRPTWQQHWECALQEYILHHHELPHGVRLQRADWWQPRDAIARPLTHEGKAYVRTPAEPTAPAAASRRRAQRQWYEAPQSPRRPVVRDWFLDMLDQWRTERRWGMQRCLCEVWRLCPKIFDGTNPNTPYRWKRSAPAEAPLGRKNVLSPVRRDTTQRAHPASDRRPVLQSSSSTPNTHLLFIKLCWLMDKHAVAIDRVVNIDGDLMPPPASSQLQDSTKEATTFTVAFSMDRGPLDMLVQIVHGERQTPSCQSSPDQRAHITSRQRTAGQRRPRSCRSRTLWPT